MRVIHYPKFLKTLPLVMGFNPLDFITLALLLNLFGRLEFSPVASLGITLGVFISLKTLKKYLDVKSLIRWKPKKESLDLSKWLVQEEK